jgi:hypothetical protein
MTSISRRDATRSPWVARALRHEIMAQPRGAVQASREYTGVTRPVALDFPWSLAARHEARDADRLTLADVSRLPVEVQHAVVGSMLDAAEGRVCREHWLASHVEWCGVDDPTLDPAYPDPTPEDYCSMPLFHDGPCDSPLAHSPDEELPFDPAYYSDGSRV